MKMANKRKEMASLQDAMEYLESLDSDDDIDKLFCEPPEEEGLSGEDSADEDAAGYVHNLPRKQLMAPCELVVRSPDDSVLYDGVPEEEIKAFIRDVVNNSYRNIDTNLLESPISTSTVGHIPQSFFYGSKNTTPPVEVNRPLAPFPDIPSTVIENVVTELQPTTLKSPEEVPQQTPEKEPVLIDITPRKVELRGSKRASVSRPDLPRASKRSKAKNDMVWLDAEERTGVRLVFPDPDYTDCCNIRPHQQFEKFFNEDVLQLICNETNKYAVFNDAPNPNVSTSEMKVVIGIMLITGYTSRPTKRSYWSNDKDFSCAMVSDAMRRDRFELILRYLHFADPAGHSSDNKIWKLRPLTDALKKNLLNNFKPEHDLSYDESMVEYYGRHGCKQFIRGKPLRFGYKMWCLCTPLGYLINFEMYQGNNPRTNPEYPPKYGKNASPLFSMIDDFDDGTKQLPFAFYFDNLFTSMGMLLGLKQRGYYGTGTLRENMLPKSCPLPNKIVLKKKERGCVMAKKVDCADIYITKWVDNSVVTIASTVFGKNPISKVGRYSRVEKKKIYIPRPYAVARYNAGMGGVDRMDQNVNAYRIGARGKKWWFPIFTWLIDVSVQNAWLLHRKAGSALSQLEFRRAIAEHYCTALGTPKPPSGFRNPRTREESQCSRYDCYNPFISVIPNKKRRRCQGNGCSSSVTTCCEKCDVGLCVKCFRNYHFMPI